MDPIVNPVSETSEARSRLAPFCRHMGVDIGYGGDPIVPEAITLDLVEPYASVGTHEQNLRGDGCRLHWFNDGVLDFVYSSHMLEDYKKSDIVKILKEWLRVVRKDGHVVLYLPDQKKYEKYCADNGWETNKAHKEKNMSLKFMKKLISDNIKNIKIVHEKDNCGKYSFDLVLKKVK